MSRKPRSTLRGDQNRNRERNPDGSFVSDDESARPGGNPRWKKGCASPNPGGLPKAVKLIRDRIGAKTGDGEEIIEFMLSAMRGILPAPPAIDGDEPDEHPEPGELADPKIRFAAAEWLGDRYFGKPKQTVELQPGPAQLEQPQTPPLRDLLMALDEKDRGDLERILMNFERARQEGRLALPAPVAVEPDPETPN